MLIEIARDCFPRGAVDATRGLLLMAHDAFARAKTAEAAVKAILPCLAKMATRFASYARQGGSAPA